MIPVSTAASPAGWYAQNPALRAAVRLSRTMRAPRAASQSSSSNWSRSPNRKPISVSGHLMEAELFPNTNPPKFTIKHIINGDLKETREGEIKYYKSKTMNEQERRLWAEAEPELKSWHKSLPDSGKTFVTVKHRTRYSTYSIRNQKYGGTYVNAIYVPPEKNAESGLPVVQNTIILLEL